MSLSVTIGEGANRPKGNSVPLSESTTAAVISILSAQPARVERWWSPHDWAESHRSAENWRSSIGVTLDYDYDIKNEMPPVQLVERLIETAILIPGSLFYVTPHGFRIYFHFTEPCFDRVTVIAACHGAAKLVTEALESYRLTEYESDGPTVGDLARMFYTHNSIAKNVARNADIIALNPTPYFATELAAHAPPVAAAEPTVRPAPRRTNHAARSISEATAAWNSDHPGDWPRSAGECPICQHNGCFGRLPNDDTRWTCFSTNHGNVGVQGANCHHGDALDLESALSGITAVEVLRRDGYIAAKRERVVDEPWSTATADEPPADDPRFADSVFPGGTPVTPIRPVPETPKMRANRNNSYLSAIQIVGHKRSAWPDPLHGRALSYNEMTGNQEIDGEAIVDEDITEIRSEIERMFDAPIGQGKTTDAGLRLSKNDISDAINQLARCNSYHPVRQYLESITWDGTPRIEAVAEDILVATRTRLNQTMVRHFFIAAVARAINPGCKLDTMLILVGRQGARKSMFFATLGGKWFMDSPIDIKNKDAFQVLRTAWIAEWAELDSISRARDINTVKGFLSARDDDYRPSYGKRAIKVKRSSVIVGTTNDLEFLVDETGNRRFPSIKVGNINIEALRKQRDQLWAEATSIYKSSSTCFDCAEGETRCDEHTWWLNDEEQALLNGAQEEFMISDAWDDAVIDWLQNPRLPADPARLAAEDNPLEPYFGAPSTSDIISGALRKPIGQWGRPDEMRIAKIMGRLGYIRRTDPNHKLRKSWFSR